jgi:hypothetical protein
MNTYALKRTDGWKFERRGASYEEGDDPFGFGFLVCGMLALFPGRRS